MLQHYLRWHNANARHRDVLAARRKGGLPACVLCRVFGENGTIHDVDVAWSAARCQTAAASVTMPVKTAQVTMAR